jgi:hypothetical protein
MPACTMIPQHNHPPEGWPKLEVRVYESSFLGVQRFCSPAFPLTIASACAHINLDKGTCDIYAASMDENVLEHEYARCEGRDAIGSSYLKNLFEEWDRVSVRPP